MKKAIALLFAFMLGLGQVALAETPTAAGGVLTHNDAAGYGVHKSVGVDWNGNTGSGMTVNCPNCMGGSGGGFTGVTVQAVAPGVSITVNNTTASAIPVTGVVSLLAGSASIGTVGIASGTKLNINGIDAATTASGTNAFPVAGTITNSAQPSWAIVANVALTCSAAVVYNLTTMAGTSGTMMVTMGSSNVNSTGVYYTILGSSTYILPRWFLATTATPVCFDSLPAGTHIALSPASATDISDTVGVMLQKLSLVYP